MKRKIERSGWSLSASFQIAFLSLFFMLALILPFAPAARAATTNASIVDFAFQDKTVNVQLGDTVIWTNNGGSPHTVTSDGGSGPLDSPTLNNGDTYQWTFIAEGTYNYHCTFHAPMKGTVIVGSVIPEYSSAALVALGLMVILLGMAAIGRKH
jgi:plastocyanin